MHQSAPLLTMPSTNSIANCRDVVLMVDMDLIDTLQVHAEGVNVDDFHEGSTRFSGCDSRQEWTLSGRSSQASSFPFNDRLRQADPVVGHLQLHHADAHRHR